MDSCQEAIHYRQPPLQFFQIRNAFNCTTVDSQNLFNLIFITPYPDIALGEFYRDYLAFSLHDVFVVCRLCYVSYYLSY